MIWQPRHLALFLVFATIPTTKECQRHIWARHGPLQITYSTFLHWIDELGWHSTIPMLKRKCAVILALICRACSRGKDNMFVIILGERVNLEFAWDVMPHAQANQLPRMWVCTSWPPSGFQPQGYLHSHRVKVSLLPENDCDFGIVVYNILLAVAEPSRWERSVSQQSYQSALDWYEVNLCLEKDLDQLSECCQKGITRPVAEVQRSLASMCDPLNQRSLEGILVSLMDSSLHLFIQKWNV
mmetsp:Transcript_45952/g.80743  ORF Transcript_45952/g.80743 Transcript_45952/m.80743 type:complete len:241 (+) Transcript_45952:512-1234(+)